VVDAIPGYAQQVADVLEESVGADVSGGELAQQVRDNQGVRSFVGGVAAAAVGLSTSLVGPVLQGFTVGLFTFYLVADGPRLRRAVCSVLRPPASSSRCGSGSWRSTAPAATCTPGRCWRGRPPSACRRWCPATPTVTR
jgi:hypothetical protein